MGSVKGTVYGALALMLVLLIKVNCADIQDYKTKTDAVEKSSAICELPESKKKCTEVKGTCAPDDSATEGFVCNCGNGEKEDEKGICTAICELPESKKKCTERKGTCVPDNSATEGFVCNCGNGEKEDEKGICADDHCASSPCENGGSCISENDSYECVCTGRFSGKDCADEVCLKNETEICGSAKCVYDKLLETGSCVCDEGEEFNSISRACEVSSYTCARERPQCMETKGHCKVKNGSEEEETEIECVCPDKTMYENGVGCMDVCELKKNIDKCAETIRECHRDNNEIEGYVCKCKTGEEEDDYGQCTEVCNLPKNIYKCAVENKECQRSDNETDGFVCNCKEGEIENGDGLCTDICELPESKKECTYMKGTCVKDENAKEGFVCNCENGDRKDEDGICTDICELPDSKKICWEVNGTCVKEEKEKDGFVCNCEIGGKKDEKGVCTDVCQQQENIDQCAIRNGICQQNEKEYGGFACICKEGDKKDDDGMCIETCKTDNDCENDAKCDRSECVCLPRTFGTRCEKIDCGKINPACEDSGGQCQYDVLQYRPVCACPERKFLNASSGRCEDPCTKKPCQNGGTCFVEGNVFKCSCLSPFSGDTCETNPCSKRPCQNGGKCYVEGNGFQCSCTSAFSGDTCETNTGNMKIAIWILCTIVAILVVTNGLIICRRYQQRMDERPRHNC